MQKRAALIIVAFLLGTIFSAGVSFDTLEEHSSTYNSGMTSSSWTNVTIDSNGSVGRHTSLAVDSQDNIHISYYDEDNKDLKYAKYDGNQWNHTVVRSNGDTGMYSSIALNSTDGVHISYYDETNGELELAVLTEEVGWASNTLDTWGSSLGTGLFSSMAIDSNGLIPVSYKHLTLPTNSLV